MFRTSVWMMFVGVFSLCFFGLRAESSHESKSEVIKTEIDTKGSELNREIATLPASVDNPESDQEIRSLFDQIEREVDGINKPTDVRKKPF